MMQSVPVMSGMVNPGLVRSSGFVNGGWGAGRVLGGARMLGGSQFVGGVCAPMPMVRMAAPAVCAPV